MPTFAFAGRTRAGELVNGERLADSVDAAVAMLRREQILVTKISAVKEKAKEDKSQQKFRAKKVPSKNLAIFTRQFSVMIDAGLPLVQCLDILGRQESHKGFAQVILATRSEVEGGASLADAMRRHPKAFDTLYVNMVAAGEAGGILDTILKRLAIYIEKNVKLQGQVKAAMIYPAAVMTIAGLVVAVILWKVIPTFAELFAGLGAELPLPTRVVIWASKTFITALPFMVVGVIGSVFGLRAFYATYGGRRTIDNILLRAADPRPDPAQDRGRPVLPHAVDADGLGRADPRRPRDHGPHRRQRRSSRTRSWSRAQSIERGETVSAPLEKTKVFPPMVTQMINVGETTGALDAMLSKIADFYEEEVDTAVAGLMTLLEPVMIAILGVIVGGIVISMYMPIFKLIEKLT